MKYFVEKGEVNFGNMTYIEVCNDYGHNDNGKIYEVNMIEGVLTFHLYILSYENQQLLCAWFNYDEILNHNHWDDILGIPKLISPNEFKHYKKIMLKPFPNYIKAYDRGSVDNFYSPALKRISTINNTKIWCICTRINYQNEADDYFLSECKSLLRYLIGMLSQFHNNKIDWKDRLLLNVKRGIIMGLKSYIHPLELLGDIYSEVDWGEIARHDPNW